MKTEKRGRCVNFGETHEWDALVQRAESASSGREACCVPHDGNAPAARCTEANARERLRYLQGCRQNCIRKREWLRGEMRKTCEDGDVCKRGELRRIMASNYRRMARAEENIQKIKSTLGRKAKET